MIKKLFFGVFVLVLLSFSLHKYYVSITEAEYNANTQKFELSIKFIGHDLEKALEEAGAPELYLGMEKENPKANEYLKKYLEKRFQMVIKGKTLDFTFVGKEINNDDFIYCFIQSEKVVNPSKITINNTLLTKVFKEQKNTVYLTKGGKKHTLNFDSGKVSQTLEL